MYVLPPDGVPELYLSVQDGCSDGRESTVTTTRYSSGIYADKQKPAASNEQGVVATVVVELTERDLKIMQMIADGLTRPQMQDILGLSKTRVAQLVAMLYDKVSVSEPVGLVRLAIRKGWVKA